MKTLRSQTILPAVMTLLVTVLFFVVIDFGVRAAKPVSNHYDWGDKWLQSKMDGLDAYVAEHGGVDVLTLGSSVGMGAGTGEWQQASGGALRCYNMNVAGMLWENVEFLSRQFILPKYKPKTVIYIATIHDYETTVPRNMEVARSFNVRSAAPETAWDAVHVEVERFSYLMSRNRNIRFFLAPPVSVRSVDPNGVPLHAAGDPRVFGQLGDESYSDANGSRPVVKWTSEVPKNRYKGVGADRSWSAVGFETFAALCAENGADFYWVNLGVPSGILDAVAPEMRESYYRIVSELKSDPRFVDVSVRMTDADYGDHAHLNSIGMEKFDRLIFNEIIAPKLPEPKPGIAAETHVPFVRAENSIGAEFDVVGISGLSGAAQLVTRQVGGTMTLAPVWPSGEYECVLFSRNDNDDVDVGPQTHEVAVCALTPSGEVLTSQTLQVDRKHNHYGRATRTVFDVRLPQPARLSVTVTRVMRDERLILDALTMRPLGKTLAEAEQTAPVYEPVTLPVGHNLLENGDFWMRGSRKRQLVAAAWSDPNRSAEVADVDGAKVLKLNAPVDAATTGVRQTLSADVVRLVPVGTTLALSFEAKGTVAGSLAVNGVATAAAPVGTAADAQTYVARVTVTEPVTEVSVDLRATNAGEAQVRRVRLVPEP